MEGIDIDRILAANIFRYVVSVLSIILNGFLLFLFARFPRLRHPQCNILVMYMVVADLLVGIGVFIRVSYQVYANAHDMVEYDKMTCLLVNDVQGIGITTGQVAIVAIAYDRFAAVFKPLKYARNDSKFFVIAVALFGIGYTVFSTTVKHTGVDTSVKISVCSTGPASGGSQFAVVGTVFSLWFLISLYSFYLLASIFIYIRLRSKPKSIYEKREFRNQVKIFATVSFILLSCTLTYGIPTAINLVNLVHYLGPDVRTFSTIYIGFGTLINALINALLYLFKHNEIRRCFILWLADFFPSLKKSRIMPTLFTLAKSRSKTSKAGI